MTNPNIISPRTSEALRKAASRYFARIAIPQFIRGVDGFAGAYLNRTPPEDLYMLITTYTPDSLAIKLDDEDETQLFLEVDLDVQQEGIPSIVAPGWYDEEGNWDLDNGEMVRKVVRPLTEEEGRELTMDLYSLMNKMSEVK